MRNVRIVLWCIVAVAATFLGYKQFFKSDSAYLAQQEQLVFGAPFDLDRKSVV